MSVPTPQASPGSDGVGSGGEWIVRVNLAGTLLFALTATAAAIFFTSLSQWVGAVTAMGLFTVGVVAFLWSYWSAVQRSRVDQIAVTQLYVLMGQVAPRRVRRVMLAALGVQVVVATITALARPDSPDGRPGSSLALGFLVPMLGFGLNGLWASAHGRFLPRADLAGSPDPKSDDSDGPMGQNANHG